MTKPSVAQLQRLIGNPRAYAVQREEGGYFPVREPLTPAVLRQHLNEEITIGTYVLHGDRAKTLVFDVDEADEIEAERNASLITGTLVADFDLPEENIGVEFSGSKGFHVWVVFNTHVPGIEAMRFGKAVTALAGVKCEVFPKQPEARDLGNLVKLPGGIHQKTKKQNNFIDAFPRPTPPAWLKRQVAKLPEETQVYGAGAPEPFHCMSKAQCGDLPEGARNKGLYHLAVMARRGGVNAENVARIVLAANDQLDVPLPGHEVQALLQSAQHAGPICNDLPDEMHCQEDCILTRVKGLFTRPGQVNNAAEGEKVVLTVAKRDQGIVEFTHQDLKTAKGALK